MVKVNYLTEQSQRLFIYTIRAWHEIGIAQQVHCAKPWNNLESQFNPCIDLTNKTSTRKKLLDNLYNLLILVLVDVPSLKKKVGYSVRHHSQKCKMKQNMM